MFAHVLNVHVQNKYPLEKFEMLSNFVISKSHGQLGLIFQDFWDNQELYIQKET